MPICSGTSPSGGPLWCYPTSGLSAGSPASASTWLWSQCFPQGSGSPSPSLSPPSARSSAPSDYVRDILCSCQFALRQNLLLDPGHATVPSAAVDRLHAAVVPSDGRRLHRLHLQRPSMLLGNNNDRFSLLREVPQQSLLQRADSVLRRGLPSSGSFLRPQLHPNSGLLHNRNRPLPGGIHQRPFRVPKCPLLSCPLRLLRRLYLLSYA
jgi:hypothetical protein